MHHRTFLFILISLPSLAAGPASDWPCFRGPNANGCSPDRISNRNWKERPPKELWRVEMHDNGYSGPCVVSGRLYIVDREGENDAVRALDADTGRELWTFNYPETNKFNYGFTECTPAYCSGKLYVFSRKGRAHCLDAARGTKVWGRDLKREFQGKAGGWDYAASALIDGDKAVFCPGGTNAAVVALNKDTGATVWKGGGSDKAGYATPAIATLNGKRQYVVTTASSVLGIDPENGEPLWSCPFQAKYGINAASPVIADNAVFITTGCEWAHGRGALICTGGQKLWENDAIKSQFSTPVYFGGHLYGTSGSANQGGELVCLDASSGKAAWRRHGFEAGALIAADGLLLVLHGKSGVLAMFELSPTACRELGSFTPLGGQSWTAPILAGEKLYVRNRQTLACFDLR